MCDRALKAWQTLTSLSLLLLTGCATSRYHHADTQPDLDPSEGLKAAEPPAFLRGPTAMVLTNAEDYTARVTVSQPNGSGEVLTGTLFQKEGQFLFVPSSDVASARAGWAGMFRFLYDANQGKGYVVSERLRGYAIWTAPVRYAGPSRIGPMTREQIEGQACLAENVNVSSDGGETVEARVWRPDGVAGPPIRITSAAGASTPALAVQLADINLDPLSPELFSPSLGAVPFESMAAMVKALTRKIPVLPYSHSEGYGRRRR